MTAEPFPAADRGAADRGAGDTRPHTGGSVGQGLAALAVAVGAVLMIALNPSGQGAFGIALIVVGVVSLTVVESVRVRRRVRWDRRHALESIAVRD